MFSQNQLGTKGKAITCYQPPKKLINNHKWLYLSEHKDRVIKMSACGKRKRERDGGRERDRERDKIVKYM